MFLGKKLRVGGLWVTGLLNASIILFFNLVLEDSVENNKLNAWFSVYKNACFCNRFIFSPTVYETFPTPLFLAQ
jgi:hypothetical protein